MQTAPLSKRFNFIRILPRRSFTVKCPPHKGKSLYTVTGNRKEAVPKTVKIESVLRGLSLQLMQKLLNIPADKRLHGIFVPR